MGKGKLNNKKCCFFSLFIRGISDYNRQCADGLGAWPSGRWLSAALCPCLLLLQLWALAVCLLDGEAGVDGPLFRLAATFAAAKLAGWMVVRVAEMPGLVGMLVVGVAMRNTGYLLLTPQSVAIIAGLR